MAQVFHLFKYEPRTGPCSTRLSITSRFRFCRDFSTLCRTWVWRSALLSYGTLEGSWPSKDVNFVWTQTSSRATVPACRKISSTSDRSSRTVMEEVVQHDILCLRTREGRNRKKLVVLARKKNGLWMGRTSSWSCPSKDVNFVFGCPRKEEELRPPAQPFRPVGPMEVVHQDSFLCLGTTREGRNRKKLVVLYKKKERFIDTTVKTFLPTKNIRNKAKAKPSTIFISVPVSFL